MIRYRKVELRDTEKERETKQMLYPNVKMFIVVTEDSQKDLSSFHCTSFMHQSGKA